MTTSLTEKYWDLAYEFGIQDAESLEDTNWATKFVVCESPADADEWQALERFLGEPVTYSQFIVASRVASAIGLSLMDLG